MEMLAALTDADQLENDDVGMTVSVLADGECQPDDGINDRDSDAALDDEKGEENAEEERDLEAAVAQDSDLGQGNDDTGPDGECHDDNHDSDAALDEGGDEDAEEERELEAAIAEGSDLGQDPAASASKKGGKRKMVSPYFNFCKQNGERAKAQVLASGQVASASAVGKALGELWRKLSDVEKAAYGKENAGDRAEHSESGPNQDESMENDGACADGQQSSDPNSLPFPLVRVKRIVRLDKDIRLVTRPGLVAITNAAQLFMESLTSGAFSAMLKTKRKSIRLPDLEAAVRSKRQFLDFLDDSMDIFTVQKDLGSDSDEGDDQEAKDGEHTKKAAKKPPLPPPGTRCITDFFGNPQSRVEAP